MCFRGIPAVSVPIWACVLLVCLGLLPEAGLAQEERVPRLAVLVVFDQLRADYLTRWEELFDKGGFRRLQEEGAWFQECHYPYSYTVTAAGHASLLTGCSPDRHGIIGNDWHDRASGKMVYCVGSDRYLPVPHLPEKEPKEDASKEARPRGVAPDRLLQPTVGDVLKEATGGKARVVSLSFKDRSAVLPAGRRPDACYWFDYYTGLFLTSTYYRTTPHPWVAEFNRSRWVDRWFGKEWVRLRPELEYVRHSTPDDSPGEGKGIGQGITFPHPFAFGQEQVGKSYYQALYNSPFGNEALLELVKRAIEEEKLGADDVPDLLCVSFSCNDPVGHCWGPDSQEVFDTTLRTDQIVRDLLATLDARVGKGRWILALTADHGVCPLPEVSRARGRMALRIPSDLVTKKANEFLAETWGKGDSKMRWVENSSAATSSVYLNRALLAQHKLKSSEVENALADWLRRQPGILTACTREQLTRPEDRADRLVGSIRKSFHPDRSGDVVAVLKPYHLFSAELATGTSHGTPHPYDTHVPLLIHGPGVKPGRRPDRVPPQAIAAIFAEALRIKQPAGNEAVVPQGLFAR